MKKCILVYTLHAFPEEGGGTKIEYPVTADEMHERVNELCIKEKEGITIDFAGIVKSEFTYKAVEHVTKYEPEEYD